MNNFYAQTKTYASIASDVARQLQAMLHVKSEADSFNATLTINPDFSLLKDHFSNEPIMPGVCLIQAVLLAYANGHPQRMPQLIELKQAKFFQAAAPGQRVDMEAKVQMQSETLAQIKATLTMDHQRIAKITLIVNHTESAMKPEHHNPARDNS